MKTMSSSDWSVGKSVRPFFFLKFKRNEPSLPHVTFVLSQQQKTTQVRQNARYFLHATVKRVSFNYIGRTMGLLKAQGESVWRQARPDSIRQAVLEPRAQPRYPRACSGSPWCLARAVLTRKTCPCSQNTYSPGRSRQNKTGKHNVHVSIDTRDGRGRVLRTGTFKTRSEGQER